MPASTEHMLFQYRLLRRLGSGGMGEVFLAEDTVLERSVAIKILSAELSADEDHRKRFRAEAKAASALAHPNICVVHEVGETPEGRPFLAMEFVEGPTLAEVLSQRRLEPKEILKVGQELAEALDDAHTHGVIHRDIKPANIMLDSRGSAKLLDFGLAKRLGREGLGSGTEGLVTQSGALLGTPFYMSPEQALGHEVDGRSDIFCLGAVLYEMVAGRRPFPGNTLGETLNSVINQPPTPLEPKDSRCPPELDRIVARCLQKSPDQRYDSAAALAQDLARLRSDAEQTGRGGLRRSFAIGAIGLFCLALAGLVGYSVYRIRQATPNAELKEGPGGASAYQKSLAVLPFDNFSAESDTDYLSDGLTEEITATLARIPGLKVAARNSAFAFKGKNADVRQIGTKLRVNTILTGSIRKVDSRLRVSAQLVNVADGFQLWSETYDVSVDDILTLQEKIAGRIAEGLQADRALSRTQPRAQNPEAYREYLRARHFWNKRTEAGLTNAIRLFRATLEMDPLYAEAYSGLAASYLVLPNYAPVRRSQYLPLARAAAGRALELDPASAEAHAVFAQLEWAAHNLRGAEDHFKEALHAAPNYATARHWYGQFLTVHGRAGEGLAELLAAVELDPLSPIIRTTIAEWHHLNSSPDRAIQEARTVVEVFPDFPIARVMLSYALISKGNFAEALEELERARRIEPANPLAYQDVSAYALARSGQQAKAREILARYERWRAEGKSVDASLALIYVGLREYENALDAVEQLAATDILEDTILVDPFYSELVTKPRFKALARKAGVLQVE